VSTGGSRRRRRRKYTGKQSLAIAWLVAVIYMLVSGGWWVVGGWTVIGVTLIALLVRAVNHAPGAQHNANLHGPAAKPASERMYHSNRP
jgi:hypothetical protein